MANRYVTTFSLIALGYGLGLGWSALAESQKIEFRHPGQAIDMFTRAPVRASVIAWPGRGGIGPCSQFGIGPPVPTRQRNNR
jgi:hypothetical protein